MKNSWILLMLLGTLLILSGCGGGGGGSDDDYAFDKLAFLNITDAKSVYIKSGYNNKVSGLNKVLKSSGNSMDKLMKITDSGVIADVQMLDKEHKAINIEDLGGNPALIQNINDEYFVIGFGDDFGRGSLDRNIRESYLCRKSDGAVYKLKYDPTTGFCISDFLNNEYIKKDNYHNLYYVGSDGETYYSKNSGFKIVKLNLSDMSSIVISPSTDKYFSHFEVDNIGNIVYSAESISSTFVCRVKATSGAVATLPQDAMYGFWKNVVGDINFVTYEDSSYKIKKVTVQPENTITFDFYGIANDSINSIDSYKIDIANYTYIINRPNGTIQEVYNPLATPRSIILNGLAIDSIFTCASGDNYYFIAGRDSSSNCFLAKVTPGSDENVKLINSGYEIYSMVVDESSEVTFNALRMADGKRVLGQVPINGGPVIILDEENDMEVTFLERIR